MLILLSSITGIFNNISMDVNASGSDKEDYGNNRNSERVEDYSYDNEGRMYDKDNGYEDFDPSKYEDNSDEYSSYATYGGAYYENEAEEYSSYNNYEYSYNNEYADDGYSREYYPDSYEKDYNNDYKKSPDKNTFMIKKLKLLRVQVQG
jgi:hypothetical protein